MRRARRHGARQRWLRIYRTVTVFTFVVGSILQAASPTTSPPAHIPPDDWTALPELKLQRREPETRALAQYVREEIRAGRCVATASPLRVDLAVLVASDGQLRSIRPRAIGCPSVEQYASGIMLRMARSNVPPPGEDRWYRTAVVFAWQ